MRRGLLVLVAALVLAGPASAFSRQPVTIPGGGGISLASTLYVPDGSPPAGGWPAIVLLHGLGGDRASMNILAETAGFAGEEYVVLTYDARGHGASGGLIGIDGPNEIADARAVHAWLRARADVADARIGAWGISYGGAAVLNSLAAGVPWAVVEVAESWGDLYSAFAPQGLPKSGAIGGLLAGLSPSRVDPALLPISTALLTGTNLAAVRAWAAARSSLPALRGNRTPVFLMQGRRDFVFGLDQAKRLYAAFGGPKRLWIGNHGHAPSRFPAADTAPMLAEGRQWFDRFLRGTPNGIAARPRVTLADEGRATTRAFAGLPPTSSRLERALPRRTIAPAGSFLVRTPGLALAAEVFGAPTVRVTATARGGWSQLVAVLVARTPAGRQIVVSAGGVPTRAGARTYTLALHDGATAVPKGSRFELLLGASPPVPDPRIAIYLEAALPAAARLTVSRVDLRVPLLR
jgi:fermentation-respiration switch protein FrsA (DUF1100 family)